MATSFKILTYNVHRGRSAFRRRDICESVAQILDFSSADAICLQEVWQHEGFDRHQLEEHLCDERWPHRVFTKTVSFRRGVQGNAVVARAPFSAWRYFDISIPKREPRGLLYTVLELEPGLPVTIFCVHLGLLERERRLQVDLLRRFVEEEVDPGAPLFIAGDFNDWKCRLDPGLVAGLGLEEAMASLGGRPGRTYPSYLPMLRLDRIYYRNCRLLQARIVRDERCVRLSDHLPVEAEFEIDRGVSDPRGSAGAP